MRALLTAVVTGAAVAVVFVAAPQASAESCEAHLAKHGVTKDVDIAEHKSGIQPGKSPCEESNKPDRRSHDNESNYRRDHFGFHCGLRGCG